MIVGDISHAAYTTSAAAHCCQPNKVTLTEVSNPYTFIDLFCGAGGFALGLHRAGLRCLAAIDSDPCATNTFRANISDVPEVLCEDLTMFKPAQLARRLGCSTVDVIVGGPPCQGFSVVRQVDGANHGQRLVPDHRRDLYRDFLEYVDFFEPKLFVIENVLGLRSADGGRYLTLVQHEARRLGKRGYRVHGQIENAVALGVPQKRRRQLIIGVRADIAGYFPAELRNVSPTRTSIALGAAIGDLPPLRAGSGSNEARYDLSRRKRHLQQYGASARHFLYSVLEVQRAKHLTNHVARPHSARDLRDFGRLREGESAGVAMRERGVEFEFPYDTRGFKDRFTRQSRAAPCSTIVAHLSKDGLMFIHPTQKRSLTPREAARVQTFPDWFEFPAARTHSFRLIGNAVPPLVGEAIGQTIIDFLEGGESVRKQAGNWRLSSALDTRQLAPLAQQLHALADLDAASLRSLTHEDFLHGWHALLSLLPELHPASAKDHGLAVEMWPEGKLILPHIDEGRLFRFLRSGWPMALEHVAREAWRRRKAQLISDEELYGRTARSRRKTRTQLAP